jgi:hypothetical protein
LSTSGVGAQRVCNPTDRSRHAEDGLTSIRAHVCNRGQRGNGRRDVGLDTASLMHQMDNPGDFLKTPRIWQPLAEHSQQATRTWVRAGVLARLKPGYAIASAEAIADDAQAMIAVLWGALLCPLFFIQELPLAMLFLAVAGASWAPYTPMETTLLQRLVPPEIRGQVFGARHSRVVAAAPLGAAFGGVLLQCFSAPAVNRDFWCRLHPRRTGRARLTGTASRVDRLVRHGRCTDSSAR